jgi:hypothetical protein
MGGENWIKWPHRITEDTEGRQIDKEKAIEFLSEKLLKHKYGLEVEIFKQSCEQKQKVKIVILVDGFVEICVS